jgi:hypothetical protein
VFCFPQLPQWQFETLGCFTPHPLKRSLLSLTELVEHFFLYTTKPNRQFPYGAFVLRLKARHGGRTRPVDGRAGRG